MSSEIAGSAAPKRGWKRRGWWLGLGAAVCLSCWIALVAGLVLGVERSTQLVLVTVAAVATEGLVWLVAAVLGLRVFEARRALWRRLLNRREDVA